MIVPPQGSSLTDRLKTPVYNPSDSETQVKDHVEVHGPIAAEIYVDVHGSCGHKKPLVVWGLGDNL